jgi:toxin-antitoxin system PIN domain toxin
VLSPDVNVLLNAHRRDSHVDNRRFAAWLTQVASGPEPFALSVLALSGFVRIATHPTAFRDPTPLVIALRFVATLVDAPGARIIGPGPRHWPLVAELCRAVGARGKLVADAQHAAVAIENGVVWATTDSDFARFPKLRWLHPLAVA